MPVLHEQRRDFKAPFIIAEKLGAMKTTAAWGPSHALAYANRECKLPKPKDTSCRPLS
jgi:hypothetical protein